jgi:hypothetical protein
MITQRHHSDAKAFAPEGGWPVYFEVQALRVPRAALFTQYLGSIPRIFLSQHRDWTAFRFVSVSFSRENLPIAKLLRP